MRLTAYVDVYPIISNYHPTHVRPGPTYQVQRLDLSGPCVEVDADIVHPAADASVRPVRTGPNPPLATENNLLENVRGSPSAFSRGGSLLPSSYVDGRSSDRFKRYFYDVVAHNYSVDRYVDDVNARYGGIDAMLMWPTYTNIGAWCACAGCACAGCACAECACALCVRVHSCSPFNGATR